MSSNSTRRTWLADDEQEDSDDSDIQEIAVIPATNQSLTFTKKITPSLEGDTASLRRTSSSDHNARSSISQHDPINKRWRKLSSEEQEYIPASNINTVSSTNNPEAAAAAHNHDHQDDSEQLNVDKLDSPTPPHSTLRGEDNELNHLTVGDGYHLAKRRKSSPSLDPIPNYAPLPSSTTSMSLSSPSPTPAIATAPSLPQPHLVNTSGMFSKDELKFALEKSIISPEQYYMIKNAFQLSNNNASSILSTPPTPPVSLPVTTTQQTSNPSTNMTTTTTTTTNHKETPTTPIATPPTTTRRSYASRSSQKSNSVSTVRPVSGELAAAVARRRNSGAQLGQMIDNSKKSYPPLLGESATASLTVPSNQLHELSKQKTKNLYAEKPVPWSPRLPSEINPVKPSPSEIEAVEISPRPSKQRVAHKPTIQVNKNNQPKKPLGIAKKVPMTFRVKYLDVIIKEYLNTGHPEEESYRDGLKEEEILANRAANKSIYVNLVAGLKKKIREKAGISSIPPDDNPMETSNGNKVVSHEDILTGKVTGTFSIEKKRKNCDPSQLSEYELYDTLMRYVIPEDQLEAYGYPQQNPNNPFERIAPLGKDNQRQLLKAQLSPAYTCERCSKIYRVDEQGLPLPITGKCIYHSGHLWNERINRSLEKRYSCCKNDASDLGCSSNKFHVHKGELELANYRGYVHTKPKPERNPNKHGIYALDCEMCYTTYGLELTRVTVIDHKSQVVYEQLVKPKNLILDYNTKFSGIKEGDLTNVNKTLDQVQADLLKMFSDKTILIGHSLDSDMKALKIFHKRFIDTAQLFPHKRGLPFKRALRTLMVENLKTIIQEDAGHDSKEDASAALRLVLWKAKTDVPEKGK